MDKFSLDLSLVARLGGHSASRIHREKERFPGMTITICKIQWLLPFKPLEQVITPRGPFMVSLKSAMKDEPNIELRCCSTCSKTLVFSVKITRSYSEKHCFTE